MPYHSRPWPALPAGRSRSAPLSPGAAIKHVPPARGAMPARPSIRSSSVSSLGSSESSVPAMSESRAAALGYGPGSRSFHRGDLAAGGSGTADLQHHPMRLTMESLASLSPPAGGVPARSGPQQLSEVLSVEVVCWGASIEYSQVPPPAQSCLIAHVMFSCRQRTWLRGGCSCNVLTARCHAHQLNGHGSLPQPHRRRATIHS